MVGAPILSPAQLIGERLQRHPTFATCAFADGHELGNHLWRAGSMAACCDRRRKRQMAAHQWSFLGGNAENEEARKDIVPERLPPPFRFNHPCPADYDVVCEGPDRVHPAEHQRLVLDRRRNVPQIVEIRSPARLHGWQVQRCWGWRGPRERFKKSQAPTAPPATANSQGKETARVEGLRD
jgi:prepilin-type processing-associated H-X9-DG protein